MPPEPLPWDRKDFFKERKHDRSEQHHHPHPHPHQIGGGGGFGGVGGFGGGPRWREPLHPHPHPYHYASPRWVSSDFRYRPPHGYGKQGGRHLYPEEASHGFIPSRPNDKILDDDSSRASGSGKYSRNSRESRGSFSQKDWKGHSCEATAPPNGPGRPSDGTDQQRSVDDMLTCNSSNPHSDSANSWDQPQSKDQHEKNGSANATASPGLRFDRENSLGSWKPLNKWTRSGSLSSRGSGFSHSSSSKSMGADSGEMKVERQPSNVAPICSPSGDTATPPAAAAPPAATCETYATPSEETNSRKKPRLGWGEGLAKYEKKKVEGVDESGTAKNGMVICSSVREPVNLLSSSLTDKSPRVTGFSDCASPATPSSVGCSSSPGIEEKQFVKAGNTDHDTTNSSVSPGVVSQNHMVGSCFNLENLDLEPITSLNSAINELLQVDDLGTVDSGFVKSTAINKLLVWKGDVLKALEMTESEIDKLEGELKLISELGSNCLHAAASSSFALDCHFKPADDQDAASDITPGPVPLELVSSGGNDVPKMQNAMDVENPEAKDEDVDSPGSATSKLVEVASSGKDVSPTNVGSQADCILKTEIKECENLGINNLVSSLDEDKVAEVSASCSGSQLVASHSLTYVDEFNLLHDYEDNLRRSILASNQETANRAAELFGKLLPKNQCLFDISSVTGVTCLENSPLIKERLLRRNHFLRFKERLISLKFRALHHLWKDDIRSLSIRKFRVKSQKKLDLSLRSVNGGHQRHRLSIRRSSSSVGNLSLIPTPETINIVSKLISDSQVKPLRDTLKMPALILDEKEKIVARFISTNSLVDDPCAVEKERSMINPWTVEEKEIFMDRLSTYGKDFRKIASFLVHKTTADCVEFYYKNHKSDSFRQTKRHSGFTKQGKAQSTNNYLVTSGKRWNRESNAASLDILGAASAIAANVEVGLEIQPKCTSKYLLGMPSCRAPRVDAGTLERSSSLDADNTDRETVAADVLAGICGSLSSEAMGSCITSAVDPGEGYHEWKCQRLGSSSRWPLTPEVTQNIDEETCSDDSCGEMDPSDWTDEEKSIFVQAVSSYGKDFSMISRCVRTRNKDQCRVFFSKARKCLGLDMICPVSGNVVRNEANGAGSDTDDTCMVETVSALCSEKSVVRMEEDLASPNEKLNIEPDIAGMVTLKPDMNRLETKDSAEDLESIGTGHQVTNAADDSLVEEKQAQDLGGDVDVHIGPSNSNSEAVQGEGTLFAVSESGSEYKPREANEHPNRSDIQTDVKVVDKVVEHRRSGPEGLLAQVLPEMGMDIVRDVTSKGDACMTGEVKSIPDVCENGPHHTAADMDSSSGCHGVSGYQQQLELESDSAKKPCLSVVPMNLEPHVCVAVKCGNGLSVHTSPGLSIGNADKEGHASRPGEQHFSRCSVSPHILKGYATAVSTAKEVGSVGSYKKSATLQSIPKLDRHHSTRDSCMQKCNGLKQSTSVGELQIQSREQSVDNNHSSSSSDVEKPRRSGDVKLFGQILTKPSSQQKASSSIQQNGSNAKQPSKVGKSFNVKFTGDQSVDGNPGQTKLDCNNFVGTENLPVRSYGFWDGNRIQTGFPSLPDSAMLLAKYPAAFSNYPVPSSRVEQLPLHGVSGAERSLNGPTFPPRDIGSSNGADYQVYRNKEAQPFTLDMKQRQDILLSEMQRRNGFDVVTGMQHQARGLVGMNVVGRGGVLVGGQCTGVSDPVAAIKMHYAQAEQYNGQAGSIVREDDSWRGKGNIGR